jgi:hypothetical protein
VQRSRRGRPVGPRAAQARITRRRAARSPARSPAESAADLPAAAADSVDRLVVPYFACACAWYETIGIGVTGGELFSPVQRHLGDPFFGVHLNPGHFIHLDEWPSSPVSPGSPAACSPG